MDTQVWMAENLDFGNYVVGTANQADVTTISAEKYCYGNDEANCTTYGGLYQWHTVMALPFICNSTNAGTAPCIVDTPHQGICPEGWHVPTQTDWATLKTWVDNNNGGIAGDEGASLKSTNLWSSGAGTDVYGWSGLPGGSRISGSFSDQGDYGFWWSASQDAASFAWYRYLLHGFAFLHENYDSKSHLGFSLRCLQD
jgi:uncharacterized protein (TIGR02145 family)